MLPIYQLELYIEVTFPRCVGYESSSNSRGAAFMDIVSPIPTAHGFSNAERLSRIVGRTCNTGSNEHLNRIRRCLNANTGEHDEGASKQGCSPTKIIGYVRCEGESLGNHVLRFNMFAKIEDD